MKHRTKGADDAQNLPGSYCRHLPPHGAGGVVAQPVNYVVQAWSFGFGPRPIHLAAGTPVTLTFVNQSGSSHDFVARKIFSSSTITGGTAPQGEIELAPHQTKTITLVPRAGTYGVHCSHFFHRQMGMSDQIVVS